jgi:hypothetical protein
LKGVAQLVMFYVCSLEVTSSSLTNLRATGGLHAWSLTLGPVGLVELCTNWSGHLR